MKTAITRGIGVLALPMLFSAFIVGSATASSGDDRPAFEFSRTRDSIVRVDTSTGAISFSSTKGKGGWVMLGSPPDPAGQPNAAGRYAITNIGARSSVTVVGPKAKQDVYLALLDHATGRVFLVKLEAGQTLEMIPEPQ